MEKFINFFKKPANIIIMLVFVIFPMTMALVILPRQIKKDNEFLDLFKNPYPYTIIEDIQPLTLYNAEGDSITEFYSDITQSTFPIEMKVFYVRWNDGTEEPLSLGYSNLMGELGLQLEWFDNATEFFYEDFSVTYDIGLIHADSLSLILESKGQEYNREQAQKKRAYFEKYYPEKVVKKHLN